VNQRTGRNESGELGSAGGFLHLSPCGRGDLHKILIINR
jgi:hypothetical protein